MFAYRSCFAVGVALLAGLAVLGLADALRTRSLPAVSFDLTAEIRSGDLASDPEEKIAEARALTRIQPANQGGFRILGRALEDAGRIDEALDAYERALALRTLPAITHARLARLYYTRGSLERARQHAQIALDRGVSLSPAFRRAVGLPVAPQGGGA